MDVILHIGAHRTGVAGFESWMGANRTFLEMDNVAHWGAERLRNGLMHGLQPTALPMPGGDARKRGLGRVKLSLEQEAQSGVRRLWVGDSNLLGTMRDNLQWGVLYPGAGVRLARYAQAFGGHVTDVVFNIRDQLEYWRSLLTLEALNTGCAPDAERVDLLAANQRNWREVIVDVAAALPGVRLWIAPHEVFAGRPDALYQAVTGEDAPAADTAFVANAAPTLQELRADGVTGLPDGEGLWMPFSLAQAAMLREAYGDDQLWLQAGADGLGRLLKDPFRTEAATERPDNDGMTKGSDDDDRQGRMAQHR